MFIIAGKSCSGKNKVSSELIGRGYKRCITYTTRPMRPKERQDIDYHFIAEKDFLSLKDKDFFAETKSYNTKLGVWYYGSALEDYKNEDNRFIILTPEGIKKVIPKLSFTPLIIYLFANHNTINQRLNSRNDNPEEAKRRIEKDKIDFKNFELEADKIVYNNLSDDIIKVADKIEEFLKSGGKSGNYKKYKQT